MSGSAVADIQQKCALLSDHNITLRAQRDELLEELKSVLRMLEAAQRSLGMWTDKNPRIAQARAAIAKVTTEEMLRRAE